MTTTQKIWLAAVVSRAVRLFRHAIARPDVAIFRRGGIVWELDLRQGIDFAIFLQGGFEPFTLREYAKLVRPGDTVFDIGANIGAHTLPLATLVGAAGRVAAFEPTDYAFGKLTRNLALNPDLAKRVDATQALLVGSPNVPKPEGIPSSWSLENPGPGEAVHPVHKGTFQNLQGAAVMRLDDWVSAKALTKVDFIKIDVDGFEVDVLEGALSTLRTFRPRIMMEFAPYVFAERGRSFGELVDLLCGLGYGAREVAGPSLSLSADLEKRIPHGGSMNVILEQGA